MYFAWDGLGSGDAKERANFGMTDRFASFCAHFFVASLLSLLCIYQLLLNGGLGRMELVYTVQRKRSLHAFTPFCR